MAKVKKAQPKMKMPPLTFQPVGTYYDGNGVSRDSDIPLGLRQVRHELWQEWHRYNTIKLAAALAGDISRKRDAKVASIYARRGEKDGYKVKIAIAELRHVNESLSEYHNVILDHAKVDKAIALLTACKPSKAKKTKPMTLKKARAMAAKGFSNTFTHDGVTVLLTPENYKTPMSKLVAARLARDAAHEAKFADVWKCKCSIHYDDAGNRLA